MPVVGAADRYLRCHEAALAHLDGCRRCRIRNISAATIGACCRFESYPMNIPVDCEHLPRDVAGAVGCEVFAGRRDIFRGSGAWNRNVLGNHVKRRECPRGDSASAIGVATTDGGMVLTVIPWPANSRASARVNPITRLSQRSNAHDPPHRTGRPATRS